MLIVVSDRHGDMQRVFRLLSMIDLIKPDVIALEMLPKGHFNVETAPLVTRHFGRYYYPLAKMLSKKYTVVGLEEVRHRPYSCASTKAMWRNLFARTRNIEFDWARTLKPFKDKKIVAFVGEYHTNPLKKAFGAMEAALV